MLSHLLSSTVTTHSYRLRETFPGGYTYDKAAGAVAQAVAGGEVEQGDLRWRVTKMVRDNAANTVEIFIRLSVVQRSPAAPAVPQG